MSDTPRTDAQIMFPGGGICMVRPEFAQDLERENAKLKMLLGEAVTSISGWEPSMAIMVRRGPPLCDPGFVAIYQDMQRILPRIKEGME